MPRATIDTSDTQRFDLKSCPGGFVELRRLSYGKYLDRQTEAMQMKMEGNRDSKSIAADIKMMGRATSVIEFRECITDHNLEDAEGNKLDFSKAHTMDMLDPRIGQEIEDLLRELNVFEAELGN